MGPERYHKGLPEVVFRAVSHERHDCQGPVPPTLACLSSFVVEFCQNIASEEIPLGKHSVGLWLAS